jgi:hypothetical protein
MHSRLIERSGANMHVPAAAAAQVWENWNPEDDVVPGQDDDESGEAASSSGPAERLPCMVTEVVSGQDFFLQVSRPRGVVTYQLAEGCWTSCA